MNLKNYTSSVAPEKSISRIEKKLVSIGAKNINKEYDKDQMLVSIKFLIDINSHTVAFALPARVKVVFDVMWKEISRPRPDTHKRIQEQAEMTAWKIIADWVEIQASMIYLEQAEILQVFMPYALVGSSNVTLYDKIKGDGFKALNP